MSKPEKRKARLPEEDGMSGALHIRLPEEMLRKIYAVRRSRPDRPNLSAVVRELIAEGITARERRT